MEVAKFALAKHEIDVEQLEMETPEIQSPDTEEVAKYSVKYAADKAGIAVIKGDFGMVIEILNGFPGPFVKFINKWLNTKQFSSLYKEDPNPQAYFIDSLGYCEPGKEPVCFSTKTFGSLINKPRGDNGNMVDSFFIPKGYKKTIAELSKEESVRLWANDRYDQLARYLINK